MQFFRPQPPTISVQELKRLKDDDAPFLLLDVRQPEERDIATIGGMNIPLSELSEGLEKLGDRRDEMIVVYCRSGARSNSAASFMISMGFSEVYNLEGGILAWSAQIDPSIPVY
ncbi:rhodanese-like domain-containing protein [Rhodocaloribacter sp.]